MSEQLAGVVEGGASEDDIRSRQHTLTIRFAKLGLAALTATLLLGVGGAHAICPCGDGICGGGTCTPPETAQTCPSDCGSVPPITPQPSRPGDIIDCTEEQRDEIGLAADWVADNWAAFEAAVGETMAQTGLDRIAASLAVCLEFGLPVGCLVPPLEP